MAFRFVHTADLHLDSPLRSLAARDEAMAEAVQTATRESFRRTVDLCLEEEVHALIIAGDLYDGKQQSMQTAIFLRRQLDRLDKEDIRTFIIRGNHDAESRITKELSFPDSVTVFTGRGEMEVLDIEGETVAVHGVSFARPSAPESLLNKFKAPKAGALNIGILHTSLNGSPNHDVYAPCSETDLRAHGFDYWALGHIHVRSESTVDGCSIVMPGIPQGRDMGEAGQKSVSLVQLSADAVSIEQRAVAPIRFERVALDISRCEDLKALRGLATTSVSALLDNAEADGWVVRLDLEGHCTWQQALARQADLVLEDLRLDFEGLGGVFLEKLDLRGLRAEKSTSDGPLYELRAIIDARVLDSHGFEQSAEEVLAALVKTLPREVRETLQNQESQTRVLAKVGGGRVLDSLASSGAGANEH